MFNAILKEKRAINIRNTMCAVARRKNWHGKIERQRYNRGMKWRKKKDNNMHRDGEYVKV